MKNIHILNGQGGAEPGGAPIIDERMLEAELETGETCFAKVPLSQSHLYALCSAAQVVSARRDCPDYTRLLLQDFLRWCAVDAHFGSETRKLLAFEAALVRQPVVPEVKP